MCPLAFSPEAVERMTDVYKRAVQELDLSRAPAHVAALMGLGAALLATNWHEHQRLTVFISRSLAATR